MFLDLAHRIEKEWQDAGGAREVFPKIATQALQSFVYGLSTPELEAGLAQWMLETESLPEQINVHNTFGQPPVTVFNNGRFVVDLYFWTGFDTSSHSHGFRGAFRVLHGRSLEELFDIQPRAQIAPDVLLCAPSPPAMNLLYAGDVRTIGPGRELSHRVVHLDNPTVTLCVKTINEPALFQWHYFSNGLAIQKRNISPGLIKKVYYYQYLSQQGSPAAAPFLKTLMDGLDISLQMNLCEDVAGGVLELEEETVQEFLNAAYARHGDEEWFELYEAATQEQAQELDFSAAPTAVQRLAGHLVNTGQFSSAAGLALLEKIAGHALDQGQLRALRDALY